MWVAGSLWSVCMHRTCLCSVPAVRVCQCSPSVGSTVRVHLTGPVCGNLGAADSMVNTLWVGFSAACVCALCSSNSGGGCVLWAVIVCITSCQDLLLCRWLTWAAGQLVGRGSAACAVQCCTCCCALQLQFCPVPLPGALAPISRLGGEQFNHAAASRPPLRVGRLPNFCACCLLALPPVAAGVPGQRIFGHRALYRLVPLRGHSLF